MPRSKRCVTARTTTSRRTSTPKRSARCVGKASERQDLSRHVMRLSAEVAEQNDREFVVGSSRATRDIVDLVHRDCEALGHGADSRRERHRQGAARAPHPSRIGRPGEPVRRRQPGGHSEGAGREHPLRTREGFVHRRDSPAARQVRTGERRHALPRRGGRPAHRAAGEAAARDPGERDRACGRHAPDQDRLPSHRRDQRRPDEGRQGRARSARTSSTGST